jgi:acetyl-CoA acetyltransferase
MGLGPAVAIPKCLTQAGMKFEDIEYWELHEAFAAQWLGVGRMLKNDYGIEVSLDRVNHNGSGIALGHPVGSRDSASLSHCTMKWRGLVSPWAAHLCASAAVRPWLRSGPEISDGAIIE